MSPCEHKFHVSLSFTHHTAESAAILKAIVENTDHCGSLTIFHDAVVVMAAPMTDEARKRVQDLCDALTAKHAAAHDAWLRRDSFDPGRPVRELTEKEVALNNRILASVGAA